MRIFKCKHKEYRVIACDPKDKHYTVKCIKCGAQWQEPKAVGEEYDMIIVDDEMRLQSGYDTLKKLQAIKKFKTPVLISIDDDKKFLVSKYIEDGFKDYILKSNLNEEIKKVNKYL